MLNLEASWSFWIAILVGSAFAVFFAENRDFRTSVINSLSGIVIAVLFHNPILVWLKWDVDTYKSVALFTLAAAGSDIIRMVFNALRNPIEYMRALFGKGKNDDRNK